MAEATTAIVAALCWLGFFCKLRSWVRRKSATQGWFCIAVGFLAAGLTSMTGPIFGMIDFALGWPNAAQLVGNLLVLGAGCAALYFLDQVLIGGTRCWAKVGYAAACLMVAGLMIVFFCHLPRRPPEPQFWSHYDRGPYIAAYRLAFLAYGLHVALRLSWVSGRNSGMVRRPSMRAGLRLVCAGGILGVIYVGQEAFRVLVATANLSTLERLPLLNLQLLTGGVCLLMLGGATMPTWGPIIGMDQWGRWIREFRLSMKLEPLWRALVSAFPQVVLARGARWDVSWRLARRVVETRDALVLLRSRWPDAPPDQKELEEGLGVDARTASTLIVAWRALDAEPDHATSMNDEIRYLLQLVGGRAPGRPHLAVQ